MSLAQAKRSFIAEAKSYLGVNGRPNTFTRWYAGLHGKDYLRAPWCAMFLAYCSHSAQLSDVVGEFAYTPSWVNWFKAHNRWGTKPRVGAIVFFDWNHNGEADHVGVVEGFKGDYIYTIEGNKGDRVERVTRDKEYVLGFGYPLYPGDPVVPVEPPKPKPEKKKPVAPKVYTVKEGDTLSAIGKRFKVSWEDIYKENRKTVGPDPSLIQPGMKLVIPHSVQK